MKKLTPTKATVKKAANKTTTTKTAAKKPVTAKKKSAPLAVKSPAKETLEMKPVKGKKKASSKKSTPPVSKTTNAEMTNPTASSNGSTLYALIIGCDLYLPNNLPEGSYPSLHGCVSDASRVRDFLRARGGLEDSNLILLTSTEGTNGKPIESDERLPTYENIVNGFKDLTARAKAGDHVYVHCSSHGGRCPSILKEKGLQPDETLVPIDIGSKSARYIRDVEIALLLKRMNEKKLVVTLFFDFCHSGGATRAVSRKQDSTGVRGVEFIDKVQRPTESLVGTLEELRGVADLSEELTRGSQTRGVEATSNLQPGCVVLAACRPFEFAREFTFDGGPRQGALTYWFLKLVTSGTEALTFRTIFDQIVKRIHDQFPDQTPMLFGNPERAILSGSVAQAVSAIPVTSMTDTMVTLGAGKASLVEVGTEYAIYDSKAKDLTLVPDRVGVVRVTAVAPTDATAEIVKTFPSRVIRAGDKAVPIGVPLKLVRKVDVRRPDGATPTNSDVGLKAVFDNLPKETWIEQASKPGDPADFVVTTDKKGQNFLICDASDNPLEIRPTISTADPNAARQLVARLVHLARYQAVQSLDNVDRASSLPNQVVTELLRTPANFERGQRTDNLKPYPAGDVPRLKPGEWVVLRVTNGSRFPINLTILDLSSDWSISVIDDDGQSVFTIGVGEKPFCLPLKAWLPDSQTKVNDILKVIATVDPPPVFDVLTLPTLDQPIPRAADRGGATRSLNPLGTLLAIAGSDRPPTRGISTGTAVTRGWSVTHVKLEVQKLGRT